MERTPKKRVCEGGQGDQQQLRKDKGACSHVDGNEPVENQETMSPEKICLSPNPQYL